MFCPRCGAPIPPNAAFCMRCGQPMGVPHPEHGAAAAGSAASIARHAQQKWIWIGVITSLALLAALGCMVALLMSAGKASGANVLATGKGPHAPLTAQGFAPSAPLQVTVPTMPADVRAWLDHLRETEDRKNKISASQLAEMSVELTKLNGLGAAVGAMGKDGALDPDNMQSPTQQANGSIQDLRPAWRELIQFFESVPPPAECQSLANNYDSALDEVAGEMGDFGDMLNKADTDPNGTLQRLFQMQGQSANTIDPKFSLADKQVSQICDKYQTAKWFSIRSDIGSPLTTSMGGIPSIPSGGP